MSSRKRSVDTFLTAGGKSLQTGESISVRLVKGPDLETTKDPVEAKATESFPIVAKFSESVVTPHFNEKPWNSGRLYQQDVPKPVDSDEETNDKAQPKRRWRYQNAPKRQWILQEQVDFLETMVARREKKPIQNDKLSSRYEGQAEHNPSKYICVMPTEDGTSFTVRVLASFVTFAQPAARKTYSLTEAEQAIQDHRMGLTMHHLIDDKERRPLGQKKNTSKARLLGKLKANEGDDDDDDIMGDLAFRNRKGGGAARKELLSSIGEGVTVSDDGVLGGMNDQMFGGRNKFGNFTQTEEKKGKEEETEDTGEKEERNADGLAMADDFYQRDVQAEYDELDYDANEQFDDDDVDLGEGEVNNVITEEFGDDEFDQELEELDMEEESIGGVEGLASAAGFKAMLAKARGESPDSVPNGELKHKAPHKKEETEEDKMDRIMQAAEMSRKALEEKAEKKKDAPKADTGPIIQTDEHGQRIISLDSVRREIWLNHGRIAMKRLMKIFDIKKKSTQERQGKFREVVKELCIVEEDPVKGRMLVLKQHYSTMT